VLLVPVFVLRLCVCAGKYQLITASTAWYDEFPMVAATEDVLLLRGVIVDKIHQDFMA